MSKLKELEKLLTQGSITRREFISRVSALGLTAAVSPVFFKSPAQAATPKKGGRFRLGLAGGKSDGVRFADAHVEETLRVLIPHRFQLVPLTHGGRNHSDSRVAADLVQDRVPRHVGVGRRTGRLLRDGDPVFLTECRWRVEEHGVILSRLEAMPLVGHDV